MRKATLLLFLGISSTLFTFSTFGQCPTVTLTYPQEVPLNSTATLQASGCKGKVLWYLTDPKKGGTVGGTPLLYIGNSLLYPISKETTFYAVCQLEGGMPPNETLCQSPTQATIKVGKTINSTANISPTSYFLPTPTAAAFARYGDIPVSNHTGLIDEDISLYTIQSKDLSLGLSLSSHASGNKVADVSSWVGLNISLNAGGVISRTVQGTPDEGQGSPASSGYYARSQAGSYYPSYSGGTYNNAIQWAIPRPSNYPASPDCSGSSSQNFLDALDGKIDTEPDLFFFKVGSYSGKFMFDSLAVAHLFPEQDIKIQAVYSGNIGTGTFDQFILTAPDGTKYYFGGTHGSTDFPQGSTAIERTHTDPTNPISTAWYLTKIESVDSQSKIFLSYQSEQYAYFDLKQESLDYQNGWQGGFNPSQDFTKNRFLGVRLSNIYTSDKNTQVNFIADSLRKDVGEYTLGEYSPGFSQAKYLNEIQILNGASGVPPSGIKRFVFKHDYFQASEGNILNSFKPSSLQSNPTFYQSDLKRLRLKSVQEKSWDGNTVIPAYQFKYDSTISFPRRLCYSQDHWGYYNGNEYIGSGVNNSLMHIENGDGIIGIPTAYLAGLSWHSNRSSNPAYIGFGALIKIIYPTSGYTVFEYSNHQRGSFAPSLNIGGLRISSISNYDTDGTRLTKKRFDYLSSGILYTRPTYFYTALQISFPCGSGGNCYPLGCPTSIASSSTLLPLSSTQGSHIGYQQVKVLEVNASDVATNGYKLYTYNTDPPTIDVMNPSSYDDFGSLRLYNYPLNPTRENYRQGTLALEEVLNSNNKLVHKTSYAYQYSSKVVPIPAMKVDNHTIGNIPAANRYYNFYRFKTGRSELRSKTTTNCKDDGTDCIVSTETYEYNSPTHFQMTRMSQSSSNGDSLINTYKYSFDYIINPSVSTFDVASNGIKQLRSKHVIVPIEELNLLKSNGNIVVMGGELTQYDATALKPSAKYLLEVSNPFLAQLSFVPSSIVGGSTATFNKDSRYPSQANIAFLYNSFGNVAQIEQPQGSGLVRSFLWSYGGSYPIAEVKNATYASVQTALTSTVINNLETSNNLSDAQIKSQLSPIWSIPNSLSSIYTYRPLRGVSTIMTSNQLNTSFFYDGLTRLSLTQDNGNNKLAEYSYQYGTTNKITTKQYRATTTGILLANSEPSEITSHEYFDGLGRLIQRVGEAHSPQAKDIVLTSPQYDAYGRLSNELTVFPTSNSDGTYVSNGTGLAQSFYGDTAPYTTPTYEQSPLNRIRSSFGLGNAWRVAGKKMQSFDESAGTNVRYYTVDVSGNISLNGTYPANSLYRTRNIDEQGNTSIEIRDIQGRLIQRQQKNGNDTLTTYYINDALGRVLAIIQPQTYALGGSIAQNTSAWSNGVFFYQYDTRGRVYANHTPNGGFNYTVYDKADRVVLNQDAHQNSINLWSFQKYDGLSRNILSGELSNNATRSSLQSQFDSHTTLSETFDSSKPEQFYYSNVSFPFSVDSSQAIKVNYYDNYTTWRKTAFEPTQSYYSNAKGLLTGSYQRYTENKKWLVEAFYHDTKNRVTESRKQDIIGNVESLLTVYRFLGDMYSHTHSYGPQYFGSGGVYVSKSYSYDRVERKTRSNTYFSPIIMQSTDFFATTDYIYNEIGQMVTKKYQPNRQYKIGNNGQDYINRPPALTEPNTQDIANRAVIISPGFLADSTQQTYLAEIDTTHSNGLVDAMQTINYGYHLRGQLNCINCRNKQVRPDPKENDFFSMKLGFEDDKRYYDGNISYQTWKTPLIAKNQQYKHLYDGVSRLTKSLYSGGASGSNYSLDSVAYDQNGNIQLLKRHTIDNLSYTYNGNRLLKVADSGTQAGFKDGTNTDDDYGYWTNGALKYDKNKGIDSIAYNSYLKKVSRVKFSSGDWINFYYNGGGTLLKRKLSNGDTWMYRDDLLMKNDSVYQITHDEGRVIFDKVNKKWLTEFNYRDIWGNLRVSFRDSLAAPVNGVYAPPVVIQTADYDMIGYELPTSRKGGNHWKFQNQERVADFDLDIDLFQYRPSDSKIGRFWSIDPLSSQYPYNSPYALQENKFGRGVELEGLELGAFISKVGDFMAGSNAAFADNQIPFPTKIRETAAKGKNQAAFRAGEAFGDGLALIQGAGETLLGAGGDAAAIIATVSTGGAAAPVAVPVAIGSTIMMAHGIEVGTKASKSISERMTNSSGKSDGYAPKTDLPRNENGTPKPDPEASGPHTQLGTKEGRKGEYKQAREFDANGKPVKDIDFTDHGRPQNHPNPHEHEYKPNPTGGTPQRDKEAKPLNN